MQARPDNVRVRSSRTRNGPIAAAAIAVIVLAACGSSGSKASTTTPTQGSSPTSVTTIGTSRPVVATATNSKFGLVLVESKGLTLYTLTKNGQPVACSGPCARAWPPLLLTSGATTATGSADITGLGTVSANGGLQVTKDGAPLHRFAGDRAPGDANGDGITSFGGVWHVVKAAAATTAVTTAAPSVTPTTATSSYYP